MSANAVYFILAGIAGGVIGGLGLGLAFLNISDPRDGRLSRLSSFSLKKK